VPVTVTGVLATKNFVSVTDATQLFDETTLRPQRLIMFVGVSWTMGAKKKGEQRFEYEQP
jgi:hypothetical protein